MDHHPTDAPNCCQESPPDSPSRDNPGRSDPVYWPSASTVEACQSPIQVGTERVTDPATGHVEERPVVKACGCNSCEACKERKRRQYVAHYTRLFWSATGLRFMTLTLDEEQLRREGLTTAEERKAYLRKAWSSFLSRVRYVCGHDVRFYRTFDEEDGRWHIHVVFSCNLSERVLRQLWFKSGGGCVLDVRPLRTPSQVTEQNEREEAERELARAVGYCVHKPLNVEGATARASQGDGYSAEQHVERRRRAAQRAAESRTESGAGSNERDEDDLDTERATQNETRQCKRVECPDRTVDSHEDAETALLRALRRRVGTWIRLKGGEACKLLAVYDTLHVHEEGADGTRMDVDPFDVVAQVPTIQEFIPMSRPAQRETPAASGGDSDEVLSDARFQRIQRAMRTASYIGEDENGTRCKWTYDRSSGRVTKEPVPDAVAA